MTKNQLSSLLMNEQIKTTKQRAKAVKSGMQVIINKIENSKDELALRRYLNNTLYGKAVKKAIELKGKLKSVSTFQVEKRAGDNAQLILVKLNVKTPEKKDEIKGKK